MSTIEFCSRCGGPLPETGGACPRCLLAAGLEVQEPHRLGADFLDNLPLPDAQPVDPISLAPAQCHAMPAGWEDIMAGGRPTEKVGDRIGHYKLLQEIGEGGCGVVYMAEQQHPVRRRVALKVIKAGMDTRQVLARFEAERQALALMDHPNIAKVLDAGATETGRPFFVMDLVKGIPITRYCDENRLDTQNRLSLFIQICRAIQHAHQKGIIHRDIKPSNILVADHDGVAVPKVIDFGLAKATNDQQLTDKTLFTAFEQFIGTPAYVSPEQARLSGLDIDTRTDIYSLGVLLYELLTGRTPFENQRLVEAGLDEIRRIIREDEPPRPSTRLSTLDAAARTEVARCRQSEPPGLIHMVRGDLDWIVMKCLEKDRNRRYETTSGLVVDIQHHLNNEPVTARPPSQAYRFQKLVRRNKGVFAAGAIAVLALITGTAVSTWQALRATQAEQRAKTAAVGALASAKKSEDVLRFIREMFARAGGNYADRVSVVQMLDWGSTDAEEKFREQPDVSAAVQYSVGYCYSKIGRWNEARAFLERALKLQERLFGYVHADTLDTARELASVAFSQGRNAEGKALCRKILDSARVGMLETKEARRDQLAGFRAAELWAYRKLSDALMREGELSQARPFVDHLISAVKGGELAGIEAGHAWDAVAQMALARGQAQEAFEALDKALSYYGSGMGNPVQKAWTHGHRGKAFLALRDYSRAEPLMLQSLPVLQKRFGDSHWRVQEAFRDLVQLYTEVGRTNEAAKYREKLLDPKTR